jgi:hypothetical protein
MLRKVIAGFGYESSTQEGESCGLAPFDRVRLLDEW